MTRTPGNDDPSPAGAGTVVAAGSGGLAGAVRAVFSVTLLSRIGGLARDVILALVFGDTSTNSAFQSAFALPNMFRRLFGEGALSAAFIPEYAGAQPTPVPAEAGGRGELNDGDRLASLTLTWLGVATGIVTVVIEVALLAILLILPRDPERDLSLRLMMVMMPFMPLICVVAILGGMLQVHGRFAASSTGPLVLNGFIIAAGAYVLVTGQAAQATTAYLFAAATTLSGATQAVWFARLLRPHARWTRVTSPVRDRAKAMLRRFVPVMVGLGTLQFSALLDMLIAMWPIWVGPTIMGFTYPLDERSNGILAATQRLYQFPLGVFGIAVATAVFPMLARHARDAAAFGQTLTRGVRLSLLLGVPASIGLIVVREDLTMVLFGGGAAAGAGAPGGVGFSAQGVARSSAVLLGYAPAVWVFSLNHVLVRAFYARGDTATPMRVSLALIGVNLGATMVLIWPLREAGLAWASALSGSVQTVALCLLLARHPGGRVLTGEVGRALARILAASAAMAGACAMTMWLWPVPSGLGSHAGRLAGVCLVGVAAYGAAATALRVPELAWLLGRRR